MTPPTETPARPWAERLSILVGTLTTELHGAEFGTYAVRQHQGRTIALTIREDGGRRLRIEKLDRPEKGNVKAWNRWADDLAVLLQHLGVAHWVRVAEPTLSTVAVFDEPRGTACPT